MGSAPVEVLPSQLAKGALRRLAQAQLEPTPDNFARCYAEEGGQPPPAAAGDAKAIGEAVKSNGAAWAALVLQLAANLDRGGRQWTRARRKDSLKRVLDGSRSDSQRLLQRLQSLMAAWESDALDDAAESGLGELPSVAVAGPAAVDMSAVAAPVRGVEPDPATVADGAAWSSLVATLEGTVRAGLPADDARAAELASRLATLADAVAAEGATALRVAEIAAVCEQTRRLFGHRHHLLEQLGTLCRELTAGLTDLAEDESWASGQCASLQARLAGELSVRGVRSASVLLAETRQRQQQVRGERQAAAGTLRQLIHDMLLEVAELGAHTGRFQLATERHATAIEGADSLESLAGVVQAMLEDTRSVQAAVGLSQGRLQADRSAASELEAKVRQLEAELRRLSEEVSTDALTQVANRRGLTQAFMAESARNQRGSGTPGLAVALIDIDNFKRLNDSLGHAAGDVALKTLAAAVRERLRPADHLARFGGEEFVVLLPDTAADEAQQVLTRLQRSLSKSLFLHDGHEVFVTFSAGVTRWNAPETLESALERADEALYEAKRNGKNRTCVG